MTTAKRDLRKISDFSLSDIENVLDLAFRFRQKKQNGIRQQNLLEGRVVALVFEKPSLRTKVAFEVAATYLGGNPVFLSSEQILASGNNERGRESIPDIARNLERFADLLIARVYRHQVIEELAKSVHVPVINALCDRHHPTQALADLMTFQVFKPNRKLSVCFIGDGNNVSTSLMQVCSLAGHDFTIASPQGFSIVEEEWSLAKEWAAKSGAAVSYVSDPREAVSGADIVYTDTFVSMGQEQEKQRRVQAFAGYQVTPELMSLAAKDAIFMHCLPAHRGEEVTDAVMDSEQSVVFDQAECRLHIAKALLCFLLLPADTLQRV